MRSRTEEEVRPVEQTQQIKIKKPKDRNKKTPLVEEKIPENSPMKKASAPKGLKTNELANVKCMECHCIGTVMKKFDEIVLFPNKVKRTLLELGGGILMPNIKAKKFVEGFNQVEDKEESGASKGFFQKLRERFASGAKNARVEKRMEVVKSTKEYKCP